MKKKLLFIILVTAGVAAFFPSSEANFLEEKKDMNATADVLKSHNIEHAIFTNSQGNQFLAVPSFGGRILAVSVGGENLFWTHPDVLQGQGGQRSWVSPEGGPKGFIFRADWKGNRDFSMMDPGKYKVAAYKENERLVLANSFQTTSNDGRENYDLTLTRDMGFEEDPLVDDPDFKGQKYQYLGIDFVHSLKNNSGQAYDQILSLWCLIQIPAKGTMIVPVNEITPKAWRGNYFEPTPEEYVRANPDSFSFFIHGTKRYKVGICPESAQGGIAYVTRREAGDSSLVFMSFPVKPEGRYADKPKTEQETNGDAIQIYSHLEAGALAFGELECHSWCLDLKPGSEASFPVKIYLYRAPFEVIQKIGRKMVGDAFDKAYIF